MVLEIDVPRQDGPCGGVPVDQVLYLPIIGARSRPDWNGCPDYYVSLPRIPLEEVAEVPGSLEAYYRSRDMTLHLTWVQRGGCGKDATLLVRNAKFLNDFPKPWDGGQVR